MLDDYLQTLTHTQKGIAEKVLNQVYNWSQWGGYKFQSPYLPLHTALEILAPMGLELVKEKVPVYVEPSNRKWNQMNQQEQNEYKERSSTTKTQYGVYFGDFSINSKNSKHVYEYANWLVKQINTGTKDEF
jgi:hypothetical protein